jgi:hypothetical protein
MEEKSLEELSKFWLSIVYRVTVFPTTTNIPEGLLRWKDIIGEEPEKKNSQPKLSIIEEVGHYQGNEFIIKTSPNRYDFVYRSYFNNPEETIKTNDIASIGKLSETISSFKEMVKKWITSCPDMRRLAFGALLINLSDSRQGAYEMLDCFLGDNVKVDPETIDFSYTINRTCTSQTSEKININRLCKWYPIKLAVKVNETETFSKYACSLEMDINTIPGDDIILDKEIHLLLFDELIEKAIEISKKGDMI